MNHVDTSSNEALISTRPLFSSTWLALFTVLRQHYIERQLAVHDRPESIDLKSRQN